MNSVSKDHFDGLEAQIDAQIEGLESQKSVIELLRELDVLCGHIEDELQAIDALRDLDELPRGMRTKLRDVRWKLSRCRQQLGARRVQLREKFL